MTYRRNSGTYLRNGHEVDIGPFLLAAGTGVAGGPRLRCLSAPGVTGAAGADDDASAIGAADLAGVLSSTSVSDVVGKAGPRHNLTDIVHLLVFAGAASTPG